MRSLVLLLTLLASCAASPRFDEARFKATHNSYSGGTRRSIPAQLDSGVRFIELDLHGDFQIGHLRPGSEVSHEPGNPADNRFGEWLTMISEWSRAHPHHSPLTIGLDLKSDFSAKFDPLHAALTAAFGGRLFTPRDLTGAWPTVDELRGRVLAVLTGDVGSRRAYLGMKEPQAFVEVQSGNGPELLQAARFFAAPAAKPGEALRSGKIIRLWQFNAPAPEAVHFPATDRPFEPWYAEYCRKIRTIE